MRENVTVAVIGAGVIGSIIIRALAQAKPGWTVIGTGRSEATLRKVAELGGRPVRDNRSAAAEAELIILAIKPTHLRQVASELADLVRGKVVTSVVAAAPLSWLSGSLPGSRVVRAMMNIAADVGKSFTVLSALPSLDEEARALVEDAFSTLGHVEWVEEPYMNALTALSGSAPAFLAEIIDALALGGMAAGLPRDLAYRATLHAMMGTASLLLERGWSPHQVRDLVITPAGTTIRGVMVLQGNGLKKTIMEAVLEAARRADEVQVELFPDGRK